MVQNGLQPEWRLADVNVECNVTVKLEKDTITPQHVYRTFKGKDYPFFKSVKPPP